jgi:predicted transcriptional regulator
MFTKCSKIGGVKMPKYPELRKLMAGMAMTKKALGQIIGKSPGSVSLKMNGEIDFKFEETKKITDYFKSFKPYLTIELVFSDVDLQTNVSKINTNNISNN